MSRGAKTIKKRTVVPDVLYKNELLSKFINQVMRDGKKSIAQKQVYGAFDRIKEKGKDPEQVFNDAIRNVAPQMEVRSRRIGGAAYQVPAPVRGPRKVSLAIRWILLEARNKSNKDYHTFAEKLAVELLDAANNEGGAIKRKETTQKMAEANKAFSHFRW